jgi:integrase
MGRIWEEQGNGRAPSVATLEKRGDSYRVIFYYQNVRFTRSLKTEDRKKAEEQKLRLEGNLALLEQGRLEYDPGKDDLATLLLTDGRLNARPEAAKRLTLGEFFQRYKHNRPPGKEGNTAYTEDIHIAHLLRLIGGRTALVDVPGLLQGYVNKRSKEDSRLGGKVSHTTIKKELGTLTSLWNRWGANHGLVRGVLSLKNLEYPKKDEKPPFQTWDQIERQIAAGHLSEGEQAELWDALYLSVPQVEELLEYVRTHASVIRGHKRLFPFVYAMFCFAAYTGARRSEMLRSMLRDLDFDAGEIELREKKKDRSKKYTTRRVAMAPQLRAALLEWLKIHPGGPHTFCKKGKGGVEPLTEQMATHHLRWALEGGKWQVVRGWHVFRHSLISNLASRGVSERVIMAVAGHLNRETTRRYTHLVPSTVHDAIRLLFGDRPVVAEARQLVVADEPATPVG